jgi:phosphoribosyl 1,2-cyclic phosphodiesterase
MSLAFTVWGARGSMAVSGPGYVRFGGDTSCYHVEVEPGHHLLIDCGTGLRSVESRLGPPPLRFTVLFTHYHLDHLQGLPVFSPLYDRANQFHFYGARYGGVGAAEALHLMLRAPLFPVPYDEVPALCRFSDLGGPLQIGPVRITTLPLRHPGGATGFRLEGGAGSVVLITDHEAGDAAADEAVVAFATGADVLLHDSQYTRDQLEGPRAGWGHSSFAAAATVAARAGVGRLVLTSHDPDRRDDDLDAFVAKVRRHFPAAEAAYPGLAFSL